jgi:signal transduction histidine kinase
MSPDDTTATTAAPAEAGEITPELLRTLFLFEQLPDAKLAWLAAEGEGRVVPAGQWIYREGDPADEFMVLLSGTASLQRAVSGDDVEVGRTDQVGAYAGATQAYAGERRSQRYLNSWRAITDVEVYVLPAEAFAQMMRDWFPMAVHLLEGLFLGLTATNAVQNQRERLVALGQVTAGLTHELNNPAAAAVRASSSLGARLTDAQRHLDELLADRSDTHWLSALIAVQSRARTADARSAPLSPTEEADREDELGEWLDARGADDAWEIAGTFVQAGLGIEDLEAAIAEVPDGRGATALSWLAATLEAHQLADEIDDAVRRVSALVDSARQYSQMDRAPLQDVDVHELLDATLTMLAVKIRPGVTVQRHYDRSLGTVQVYAAELNQVWTNLIVNALQAMGDEGVLTITTSSDGTCLTVEVNDTGPGIPADVQNRVFEPFFTTKPVGQGTGLGLDISYKIVVKRHHGDLTVRSAPGDTTFTVTVPLHQDG